MEEEAHPAATAIWLLSLILHLEVVGPRSVTGKPDSVSLHRRRAEAERSKGGGRKPSREKYKMK